MSEEKVSIDDEILLAEKELRISDPDLQKEHAVCPFSGATKKESGEDRDTTEGALPYQYIPLRMGGRGGTHMTSEGSRALIENEVSLDDLKKMTGAFYNLAFQDKTLDKFIRSHSDPHGDRFAKWIHQKLSGSDVWDADRQQRDLTPVSVAGGRTAVVYDRSSAHAAAWYSPKRPKNEVGRHFKLDECRVWMRLHFYAMRKIGIVEKSPSFADYYVRFIGHFVAVYEGSAPMFARESFRWSAKQSNIDRYIEDGRVMKDVLGLTFRQSVKSLPENEVNDDNWPYAQTQ
eukprot:scaffold2322_cov135-Cylindrotheca_fusiformis.AAC.12